MTAPHVEVTGSYLNRSGSAMSDDWEGLVDPAKAARVRALCAEINARSKLSRGDYDEIGEVLVDIQEKVFTRLGSRQTHGKGYQRAIKAALSANKIDLHKNPRNALLAYMHERAAINIWLAGLPPSVAATLNSPLTIMER